jgi:hypothetical protein
MPTQAGKNGIKWIPLNFGKLGLIVIKGDFNSPKRKSDRFMQQRTEESRFIPAKRNENYYERIQRKNAYRKKTLSALETKGTR